MKSKLKIKKFTKDDLSKSTNPKVKKTLSQLNNKTLMERIKQYSERYWDQRWDQFW